MKVVTQTYRLTQARLIDSVMIAIPEENGSGSFLIPWQFMDEDSIVVYSSYTEDCDTYDELHEAFAQIEESPSNIVIYQRSGAGINEGATITLLAFYDEKAMNS